MTVVILGFAGWYVYTQREVFAVIQLIDWIYLPLVFGFVAVSIAISGLVLMVTMHALGVHLRWTEWYGLTAIGSGSESLCHVESL